MTKQPLALLFASSILCSVLAPVPSPAAATDAFRVKRQQVFEFAKKPVVTRKGDDITVRFTAKGACDVTVVVENGRGKIIRHLGSGVLGKNAPKPFKKDSLEQTITWDGKNDKGVYVDDKDSHTIRVSLGLKPQFERSLFWTPRRRPGEWPPLMAATAEGMVVYSGGASIDQVILFDRGGNYVRTVYPFPSDKIRQAKGLAWHTYPQDKKKLPVKTNFMQCTMLTSGSNGGITEKWSDEPGTRVPTPYRTAHYGMYGQAAKSMAIRSGQIALVQLFLNRLGTDGTTAGLPLLGPSTTLRVKAGRSHRTGSPTSIALSPDGKTLYMTGYIMGAIKRASQDIKKLDDCRSVPVVMKLDMETGKAAKAFLGQVDLAKHGSGNGQFKVPTSVDVDDKGRVYVADYLNDRIQVFKPDATFLKSIKSYRPAFVRIHRKTGDIMAMSWRVRNQFENQSPRRVLMHYGPFDNPREIRKVEFAPKGHFTTSWGASSPIEFSAEIDSWSDPLRLWIAEPWTGASVLSRGRVGHNHLRILEFRKGKFHVLRDFVKDIRKKGAPVKACVYYRQRLYVNPANGRVYVAEGDNNAVGKSFHALFEIDPNSGKVKTRQTPFNAEDMCFDLDGYAYLRSINMVGRYDSRTWRETPWDYGEQHPKVGYGWMSGTRYAKVVSGLKIPADGNWHHGGMYVSTKGHLIVACGYNKTMSVRTTAKYVHRGKKYQPTVYPGRCMGGRAGMTCLHVWDRHGKLITEDTSPGHADLYGIGLDADDNLYLMTAPTWIMDGKRYHNRLTGVLMKFNTGKGRVLSVGKGVPIPLSPANYPKRPHDLTGATQGKGWLLDAAWMYGGVGFGGKNLGIGCACWNARFAFDYLNRSFAPEIDRYRVAVLDANGNLILRIGRYGNADEGKPLITAGSPPNPRSIGGDEVSLFHAPYLATHTDRRLFIADPGNSRILSVKLGYHTTEEVVLKDVPDKGK